MGRTLGVDRRVLAAAVGAVAVVLVGAVAVLWVTSGTAEQKTSPRRPSATTLPAAPVEWPPLSAETASAVRAYLAGPGAGLVSMRATAAPLTERLSLGVCRQVLSKLGADGPAAMIGAAGGIPDRPLSDMFVNLTGQVARLLSSCSQNGPSEDQAKSEQADLVTLDRFIDVRLQQVEAAS